MVSKADGLHECESRNTSDLLIRIALMPKHEDTGENCSWFLNKNLTVRVRRSQYTLLLFPSVILNSCYNVAM